VLFYGVSWDEGSVQAICITFFYSGRGGGRGGASRGVLFRPSCFSPPPLPIV